MTIDGLNKAVGVFLSARPGDDERIETGVPGLWIYAKSEPTTIDAAIYTPIVSLTLQGEKEVRWGTNARGFRPGERLIVSHDLPVQSCITQASMVAPFRAIALNLDLPLLRDLRDTWDGPLPDDDRGEVIACDVADEGFADALTRYFALHKDANSARLLGPILHRELHARLLIAPHARMLRRLLNQESQASQIARSIAQIRQDLSEPVIISDLARAAGMSVRSFHAHFKTITETSPLQYQKELRLIEARRLIQAEGKAVGTAAFEVGYESSTQFSREFARRFGIPPSKASAQCVCRTSVGD
ncbi:MAG: AraC family transcriptional regulator [Pseudomonadota bacterium]